MMDRNERGAVDSRARAGGTSFRWLALFCCVGFASFALSSCAGAPPAPEEGQENVRVAVSGMTTAESTETVRKTLLAIPWVRNVQIEDSQASLIVDSADYDAGAVILALVKAGFGGELLDG